MPGSIAAEAQRLGSRLLRLDADFGCERGRDGWTWWSSASNSRLAALPPPALFGEGQYDNAAAVLQVLDCLRERLPVTRAAIEAGLRSVRLSGRFQIVPGPVEWVLDVAHNPAAAQMLAEQLRASERADGSRRTFAVCGILGDKDVEGIAQALRDRFTGWFVAGLAGARALAPDALAQRLTAQGANVIATADSVAAACELARRAANPGDRIVVFGSFMTVGPALEWLEPR
jgi:dihydrofolate synthase/folylpolyglutamate synthase